MFPRFAKRLSGLVLGCALGAGPVSAQTTGYANPVPLAPAPVAAPGAAPVGAPVVAPIGAPVAAGPVGAPIASPVPGDPYTPRSLAPGCGPAGCGQISGHDQCAPGVWVNVDYLLTWIKDAPSPGVLAIKTPVFGRPEILGNHEISNNAFNGVRLQAGTWINENRTVGYEASVYTHEHRSYSEGLSSGPTANVFRPFIDTANRGAFGVPGGLNVAVPPILVGGVTYSVDTRLTGWDANIDFNNFDDGMWRGDILVGVRGQYLNETINIYGSGDVVNAPPQTGPLADRFGGLQVGQRLGSADRFNIHNDFLGGQVGYRLTYVSPRWIATTTFKVAGGSTQELLLVSGQSISTDAGVNNGGGLLANNGNFGRYYTDHFAVIPELNLNIAYRLSSYCSVRAGYNAFYWSNVSRATQDVPKSINSSFSPGSSNYGADPRGFQTRPTIDTTDFWAQGINLGLEFRF